MRFFNIQYWCKHVCVYTDDLGLRPWVIGLKVDRWYWALQMNFFNIQYWCKHVCVYTDDLGLRPWVIGLKVDRWYWALRMDEIF